MYEYSIYKTDNTKEVETLQGRAELEQIQEWVGGYIEVVSPKFFPDQNMDLVTVYCNEEGKLKGLPVNPYFKPAPWGDQLLGNVVIEKEVA